jgi:hypothetical protein
VVIGSNEAGNAVRKFINTIKSLRKLVVVAASVAAVGTALPCRRPHAMRPLCSRVSGIALHGAAKGWWAEADGRYARGTAPTEGSVLAFRATPSMPSGHVATVAKVIDARHVKLNHANWSRPGMIERDAMAEDVSPNGDWSQVRVWYARSMHWACAPHPPSASSTMRPPRPMLPSAWPCATDHPAVQAAFT